MIKILKFINKIILSNFQRLQRPYKLTYAVTYDCNLKCKMCFIWKKEKKKELSINEIDLFFKKQNYFSWIDLTGGEISLRRDLLDIVSIIFKYSRNLCILHFPTNGQLAGDIIKICKTIKKLSRGVALIVTVGLDGPQHIHNEIRGSSDVWRNAVETFIGLKRNGFRHVYFGYTLFEYNRSCFEKMFSEIKIVYPAIRHSDFHCNLISKSAHYFENYNLSIAYNMLTKNSVDFCYMNKKFSFKGLLARRYWSLATVYTKEKKMPLPCQALSATVFLDPYGDIYPCISYGHRCCNILDINFDLDTIWKEKFINHMYSEISKGACGGCWTPCEAYPAILGSLWRLS
ncbi:MAG: radical SAM protein [Candidatus Omnitrophota bacterium]